MGWRSLTSSPRRRNVTAERASETILRPSSNRVMRRFARRASVASFLCAAPSWRTVAQGITAALLWCTKWWDGRAHVTRAPREPCEADALAVRYGELRPNVWMHGVFATRTRAAHARRRLGGVALVLPNDAAFARLQLVARVREYALHYYVDGGAREVIIGPRFFAATDRAETTRYHGLLQRAAPDVVAMVDDAARRCGARCAAARPTTCASCSSGDLPLLYTLRWIRAGEEVTW